MPRPKPETFDKKKVVAENRRARFDYAIEDKYEAGIALTGTEVKSLRFGEGSIAESYAEVRGRLGSWLKRLPWLNSGMLALTSQASSPRTSA